MTAQQQPAPSRDPHPDMLEIVRALARLAARKDHASDRR
jgi:hypothetical protein